MKKTILYLFLILLSACGSDNPVPKPFGFHKIRFPQEKKFVTYSNNSCPFQFEYPAFGKIDNRRSDSCWVDIEFPDFQCKWHITYKNIKQSKKGSNYEDYRRLIYKHSQKASEITETPILNKQGKGVFFEMYGEVPTPAQFYFTDTTQHAVMASFYFFTALKNDSLAPVIQYMKNDMKHLVESIQWK